MSDFFQNGVITTLQRLTERPVEEMEADLRKYSRRQKIALLLPALYSEFEKPAMLRIVQQLEQADWLHRIVLSLDRADEAQFQRVREILSALPAQVGILWNDGPRIQGLLEDLRQAHVRVAEQGKGRGVWLAMGYALTDKEVHTLALHDCDIVGYDRELLVRLVYPIVHPATDFEFSKGYYARITHRLYGRVTRLFYTPLIRSLKKILGSGPFLDYLDSFRYALSGEFAFIRSLAKGIRISPNWGLEVSLLSEVYRKTNNQRVCQVEIAETYEHKHRELGKDDPRKGLVRMAGDIAKTLFRVLAQDGVILSKPFFDSLQVIYLEQARRAIESYDAVARLNGLDYDRDAETQGVEAFSEALRRAQVEFRQDPVGEPFMSAWVRVRSALPDFPARLAEAVAADCELEPVEV